MDETPKYKKNVIVGSYLMASTVKTIKELAEEGIHARQFPLTKVGFETAKRVMTESLEIFLEQTWQTLNEDNIENGFN